MRKLLIFIAALSFWGVVWASDLVARNGNDTVRLTQAACHAEILPLLAMVFPTAAPNFRAAHAEIDGASFRACWILRPDGKVLLQYEDTDTGLIHVQEFQRAPGV